MSKYTDTSGINIRSGFKLDVGESLDARLVVSKYSELEEHSQAGRTYEGMIVYVEEYQVNYQYKNGQWESFSVEVQDTLDSYSTVKGLSANQGRVLKQELDNHTHEFEEIQNVPNFATKEYVDEKIGEGGGSGNANIHVGTEPPADTTYMWIDTSAPCNLDVTTYEGRMRLKYIEMLNLVVDKLNSLSSKLSTIEKNIYKISSDNADKATELKSELASIRAKVTSIQTRIQSTQIGLAGDGELLELKNTAKTLRKEMKTLLYSLADLSYEVKVVLDSEVQYIQPDNPDNPDTPTDTDGSALSTEDGMILLTEDGLAILIDGAISSDILADAILTEMGYVLLTEDGKQLLKG